MVQQLCGKQHNSRKDLCLYAVGSREYECIVHGRQLLPATAAAAVELRQHPLTTLAQRCSAWRSAQHRVAHMHQVDSTECSCWALLALRFASSQAQYSTRCKRFSMPPLTPATWHAYTDACGRHVTTGLAEPSRHTCADSWRCRLNPQTPPVCLRPTLPPKGVGQQ